MVIFILLLGNGLFVRALLVVLLTVVRQIGGNREGRLLESWSGAGDGVVDEWLLGLSVSGDFVSVFGLRARE